MAALLKALPAIFFKIKAYVAIAVEKARANEHHPCASQSRTIITNARIHAGCGSCSATHVCWGRFPIYRSDATRWKKGDREVPLRVFLARPISRIWRTPRLIEDGPPPTRTALLGNDIPCLS